MDEIAKDIQNFLNQWKLQKLDECVHMWINLCNVIHMCLHHLNACRHHLDYLKTFK